MSDFYEHKISDLEDQIKEQERKLIDSENNYLILLEVVNKYKALFPEIELS